MLAAVLVIVLGAILLATAWRPGFSKWTAVIIVTGIVSVIVVAALWVVMVYFVISDSDGTTHDRVPDEVPGWTPFHV